MKLEIRNRCSDFTSYRAARVKSLFNAESGCNFDLDADIPVEGTPWKIGVIVGPSGSGKTSLGRRIFGTDLIHDLSARWPGDAPIVDAIAPSGDFNEVTGALAAVGLGDVPAWLRPFQVLSNGEKFRAGLARLICERPAEVVVDEFTSVVDRQIAKFGALAFQKAWRRTEGRCVLLSCHYDILEWLEPDWIFDTLRREYSSGGLRRPRFDLEIVQTDGSYWPLFEPHHYLKLGRMIGANYFVGTVEGEPVCHLAVSPHLHHDAVRACRMVVLPEWQGAGIGMRFLNAVLTHHCTGYGKWGNRVLKAYFHTSHPGLCSALRRDKHWTQVSQKLFGGEKNGSAASMKKSGAFNAGFGGHFRAVQGFRFQCEQP